MMPSEEMSGEARMSGFGDSEKPFNSQGFLSESLGQSYPHHYPQGDEPSANRFRSRGRRCDRLLGLDGAPSLPAAGTAALPSGPAGKFVFFRKQVIAWILQQQKKGGR
jgi:hypothetical protein